MSSTPPLVLQKKKSEMEAGKIHHSAFDLSVMQLNAWLIPVRPSFPGCLDFNAFTRAKRMGEWLEEQTEEKRLDIAIVQEVWTPWRSFVACSIHSVFCCKLFGRHFIERSLTKVLPHHTKVHGSRACDCTKRFFDSGLVIASRFPIIAEKFRIYPSGSPHDALSSKGILVAALRRPSGGIVIVGSSHLDAGDDDSFKIDQLKIAITTMREFSHEIAIAHPEAPIEATMFGSDMNIDGIEFWSEDNSYAQARVLMEAEGFQDSWMLTKRAKPSAADIANRNYTPDNYPGLGITSDQHNCVKRLDYVWVCPGRMGDQDGVGTEYGAAAPAQQAMHVDLHRGSSKKLIKKFGVSVKTELNDGVQWRSSESMRAEVEKAVEKGDPKLAKRLASQIDLHDREMRLSDHAALFAKLHFFPQ